MRLIVSLLCLCFAQLASAVSPTHIEARYDVLKGGIKVATITETYTRTENNYHIDSVTKPYGLLALFKAETPKPMYPHWGQKQAEEKLAECQ